MSLTPEPVWPIVVLAVICLVDAILCLRPARFIADCLRDVGWPESLWWLMPFIKFSAAAGLIAGIWVPVLGLVTIALLVIYFIVAIGMHVRARDFGRNLFVNATAMLLLCTGVLTYCFLLSW